MKKYRILTAQVYHQLMAGVEEYLKEGFTLVGGLCVESFKENGIRYRNFYQAIVEPDTLVFGQGVKFPEVVIQPLGETGPTPEGVYSIPKRPPMTKTTPTQKGFYWRQAGPGTEPVIVFVSRHLGFWVYELSGHDERIGIWDNEHVYWSAKPITPDELPKEEA